MYKTMIITVHVDSFTDGRKLTERIENEMFHSNDELGDRIKEELGDEAKNWYSDNIIVWELTDFMDACNNGELSLNDIWIGYVQLKL